MQRQNVLPYSANDEMTSTTAFMMEDTELPDDSGESIMEESDFESLEAEILSVNHTSRFYWLGKRVFTQLLADAVFRENASASTGDDLDVGL